LVASLAFSPDGLLLAAEGIENDVEYGGSSTSRIAVWDLRKGNRLWKHDSGAAPVALMGFMSANREFLTVSDKVRIRDARSGRLLRTINSVDASAVLAISADGRLMACAAADGTVSLVNATSGKVLRSLPARRGDSYDGALFSPDGKTVALTGSSKGPHPNAVELVSVADRSRIADVEERGYAVRQIAFAGDGKTLAILRENGDRVYSVYILSTTTPTAVRILAVQPGDTPSALAVSPNSVYVAYGTRRENRATQYGESYDVCIQDVDTGKLLHTVGGTRFGVADVEFSPDGKLLAAGGDNAVVWVWNVQDILGGTGKSRKP
jgi:WD40 repeat protein